MKRNNIYILLISFLAALSGCFGKPNFSDTPSISYRSMAFIEGGDFKQDTIAITINYRDGNGDLGLNSADTNAPYQRLLGNGGFNPDYFNITVDCFQRKANGRIDSIPMPSLSSIDGTFYGRFPRIRPEKSGALEGTLRYDLKSFYFFDDTVSEVCFKLQIQDRSLNKSERIITPFIKIK